MEKSIKRYFPVFLGPTFLAFIIGFIVPFIMGLYLSLCDFRTVTDAKFVGLSNFVKAFQDTEFLHAFLFTSAFTVVTVVLINVIAFAVAMVLTQNVPGTNIFRTTFFMPNLIGGIVLGYIWQLIFNGILFRVTIPNVMPSITICMFLSLTNGFKLFDQNLSLTAGEPMKQTEGLALNIFNTFYARVGWQGVGQAKAVVFFILVVGLGLLQLRMTRSKEVQQ